MKANVCQLLDYRLRNNGFNVLNRGRSPSWGGKKTFNGSSASYQKQLKSDLAT